MEINTEAKKRIAFLVEERDLPLAPLAAKIGVSQSTLWNFIYGDTKNFSKIHHLATELKVSLDWIVGGDAPRSPAKGDAPAVSVFRVAEPRAGQDNAWDVIPILGQAIGVRDAIRINWEEKIGDTERHPTQRGIKNTFAIYVTGDAMSPRYRSGELVYAASGKPPAQGQDCIVELINGESYLREFVARKGDEVICRQLKPAKEWRRAVADIVAIHSVVGRG